MGFTLAQDGDGAEDDPPPAIISGDPAETDEPEATEEPTEIPTEAPTEPPVDEPEVTDEPVVEPTEEPEPTDEPTAIPPTEVPGTHFADDFQDGDTTGWTLSGDWALVGDGRDNYLVSGAAGSVAAVTGVDWPHFVFAARVRVGAESRIHVNLRGGLSVSVDAAGRASLLQNGFVVGQGPAVEGQPDTWRLLNIQAFGGTVTVAVDRVVQFSYSDPSLLGQGTLSLSNGAGSVAFDDVVITRLDEPEATEIVVTSEPTATPTEEPEEAYPQKPKPVEDGANRPVATDLWAVILQPGVNPVTVAQQNGFEYVGPVGELENTYLFRLPGSATDEDRARDARQTLRNAPGVEWFEQQFARQQSTRQETIEYGPRPVLTGDEVAERVPGDPLFNDQWHLLNTGQFGGRRRVDVNVVPAWDAGYTGAGIVIAIVDDGLQHDHPDLSANYVPAGSYDFNGNDTNPYPNLSFDAHGTSAGGVAAARDNAACGVGAAYRAALSGIRLIAGPSTDAMEASALNYAFNTNHIYNNSWGPADNGVISGPGALTQAALLNGINNGRGGRGSIFVWAAGNGRQNNDNVNADGYANSPYTIAVGAIDNRGIQSFYSEPGAAMFVTAPSSGNGVGITTTDLMGSFGYNGYPTNLDCTNQFGGTSSSSPLVAGVVALMLDANPNLGWRDVQHILARTAVKNHTGDGDWRRNRAGFNINHKYGFGMVNATAAVATAQHWFNMPARVTYQTDVLTVNQIIPDNNRTGITSFVDIAIPDPNFVLEHVEVVFNATHTWRGDLQIELTGPTRVKSLLINQRLNDSGNNYTNWRFMTVRHWGENANGRWRINVSDRFSGDQGTFNSWRLVFHGYSRPAVPQGRPIILAPTNNAFINSAIVYLDWTDVVNATAYRVQIAPNAGFRNIFVEGSVGSSDAFFVGAPDGRHFWRVIGRNVNEYGRWSAARRFTVDTIPPGEPTVLSPADGAVFSNLRPTLRWRRGIEAHRYHLQVATSAAFGGTIIYEIEPLGALTRRIPAGILTPGATYYWRVRSIDRAGNYSGWTPTTSFTIP